MITAAQEKHGELVSLLLCERRSLGHNLPNVCL
jgi:hypothetical protein